MEIGLSCSLDKRYQYVGKYVLGTIFMKDIFQRELDGELIATNGPEYGKIIGTITDTIFG